MGSISNQSRCDKFIDEFHDDIMRVYGLPAAPWLAGQYLEGDLDGRVKLHIDLRLADGSMVSAVVEGPTFYAADAMDEDNVDYFAEAMDVAKGLSREDIVKRMVDAKLISEEA